MALPNPQPASSQVGDRIGVDLGSHHLRIGVLAADGELRDFHRADYTDLNNGPALAAQLRALLQQTVQANPAVTAIGIAFPGLIQHSTQRILKLEHAPALVNSNLHAELQAALNLPVHFENSANAAAFAEMQRGVARGLDDWLYLHIGVNVSAGLILGGQLQRGKSGLAGALGEMAIDPEHTGEFVPLESMVSAENIVRRTERRLQRDSTSSLSRLKLLGGGYTYDDIIDAADKGDDLSRLMLERTGMFIGMVMAVQTFYQFDRMGLATRLGSLINITLVRELGPVLAATMLAGRIGTAMAAEIATMKVTEQVDALSCLGANPIHYLVVPRLLACSILVPLLTIFADFMGIMGGALICTRFYGVEAHFYWQHSQGYVQLYDIFSGLIKAWFFGTFIGLISCHRGLNSQPGAEGVGRASTETFVASFIIILVIDFFLGMFLVNLYQYFWGEGGGPSLLG